MRCGGGGVRCGVGGVRCGGGGVALVFVSRSRRLVPLESVTFMPWEAWIFWIGLVRCSPMGERGVEGKRSLQ